MKNSFDGESLPENFFLFSIAISDKQCYNYMKTDLGAVSVRNRIGEKGIYHGKIYQCYRFRSSADYT